MPILLPAIVWAGFILFVLTFNFNFEKPSSVHFVLNEKLVHLTLFSIESWLLAFAYQKQAYFGKGKKLLWVRSVIVLTLYAGLTEIIQAYLPYRSAEWSDWMADFWGILVGIAVYEYLLPGSKRKGGQKYF